MYMQMYMYFSINNSITATGKNYVVNCETVVYFKNEQNILYT